MPRVCIVVPTFSSGGYFGTSFAELLRAARELAAAFETMIIVVLNGSAAADELTIRAAVSASDVPASLIVTGQAGKNGAINLGLAACVEQGFDIIHVVDDDQRYAPGTLLTNVTTLVHMHERLGLQGLVGSRHLAVLGKRSGILGRIAALAFEERQEPPKFCIGGSMCAFVESFPKLPDDESGIADDAFVCNSFYARFRDLYRTTGIMPIVFPRESRIYFNVAVKLSEYERQQVRIRYGVLAAYRAFPELEQELRNYFDWKFHCDFTLRPQRPLAADVSDLFRWRVFSWLRGRANGKAEARLLSGVTGVPWSVARSTKFKEPGSRAVPPPRGRPLAEASAERNG